MLPQRRDFAQLWRFLEGYCAAGPAVSSTEHLLRQITRGQSSVCSYGRALVCLQVLDDTGLIRVTLDGGNQRLLKPSSESRRDFRLQRGIMGVASFGVGSEAGSFGTSGVWMQGHGDATLLYLGAPGETTARRFTFTSNPQGAFTLDGGAQGGVTFTGRAMASIRIS